LTVQMNVWTSGEAQIVEILKQQKAPPAVPDDYVTITL